MVSFTLDPSFGESVVLDEVIAVDADHGLTEVGRDVGQEFWVVVVRGGQDDGAGPFGRGSGLEDTGTDEDAVASELHHESGVGGGGNATGGKVDDGKAFEFADFEGEFKRNAVIF